MANDIINEMSIFDDETTTYTLDNIHTFFGVKHDED
jgi:hypothetical protein